MNILLLCLGNICRSPLAEAVLRHRAGAAGHELALDSAGLGGWHRGNPPDPRAQAIAASRGYDLSGQRARQLIKADFNRFDLILAMDSDVLAEARALAPRDGTARLACFLDYAGLAEGGQGADVPDPYYDNRFGPVLDLIEAGADGIITRLSAPGP